MLYKKIEKESEILAAKMLEFEAFSRDWALIDAGERLKQFAAPLIYMLKSNVALERMYHCLYEIDAFFRIRQSGSKHLAFADFASPFSLCPC